MANIDALKILGSLLQSGALSRGSGSNVLGSVIGALTGGGGSAQGGGLGGLLGSMLGGGATAPSGSGLGGSVAPASGGGLGDLLGGLLGGAQSSGGGLGDLLGMAMSRFGQASGGNAQQVNLGLAQGLPSGAQAQQANDQATVLIRAMINAAKADGRVDAQEQQKIVDKLGDATQDEIDFVRREMAETLDVEGFIRGVPRGMEQQVYAMSLMAIDLDTNAEGQYLHQLAQGFGMSSEVCNAIHDQFGAPKLYR